MRRDRWRLPAIGYPPTWSTSRTVRPWRPARRQVASAHGNVDGLVHLAAIIQPFEKVKDLDDAVIERVINVNWWGTLYLDRAFLPVLLERPEGHIVNTSSMGGFIPVPGQTIYGASKAAVKLLTEGLNAECRGTPVHMTVVMPGGMATNMPANSGVSVSVDPARAAEKWRRTSRPLRPLRTQILDGMERNAYRVLIGRDAKTDGPALPGQPSGRCRVHRPSDAGPGPRLIVTRINRSVDPRLDRLAVDVLDVLPM